MKYVRAGQKMKISKQDIRDINKVANIQRGNHQLNVIDNASREYETILVKNNLGVGITKYSVVGVKQDDMQGFSFAPSYFREDEPDLYPFIQIELRRREKTNGWKAVEPSYRNHQGMIGITQQVIPDGTYGLVKIAGYSLARVDIKSEYIREREHVRLVPPEEINKGGIRPINISLEFDQTLENHTDFGSPILVQPGKINILQDDDENDYIAVPEGKQIARVWLGSSFRSFWYLELWRGVLE